MVGEATAAAGAAVWRSCRAVACCNSRVFLRISREAWAWKLADASAESEAAEVTSINLPGNQTAFGLSLAKPGRRYYRKRLTTRLTANGIASFIAG